MIKHPLSDIFKAIFAQFPENFLAGGSTVLAMAESVECFPIPVPCHILKVSCPNSHFLGLDT